MAGIQNPNLTKSMNGVLERAVLLPGIYEQLGYDEALGFLTLPTASSNPDAVTIVGFNIMTRDDTPKPEIAQSLEDTAAPGTPRSPTSWSPAIIPNDADTLMAGELWQLTNKGGVPDERIYNWPKAVAGRSENESDDPAHEQYTDDLIILQTSVYRDSIRRIGTFGATGRLILNGYHRLRTPSPSDPIETHEAYLRKVNGQYGEGVDIAIVPQTLDGRRTQLMRRALSPRGVPSAFAVLLNGALEVREIGSCGAYGKARAERQHEKHKRADAHVG